MPIPHPAPETFEALKKEDPTLVALFTSAATLSLDAGAIVFHPGSHCGHYYLLLEGQVRIFVLTASGREIELYQVRPGEGCVMTTACLLGETPYNVTGVTLTPVRVLAIPAALFQATINRSPPFQAFVFKSFAQRLQGVLQRLEALMDGNITQRLIDVLLEAHVDQVVRRTHQSLADQVGTAREVISRHLKALEHQALLELGRGRITLIDLDALMKRGLSPSEARGHNV